MTSEAHLFAEFWRVTAANERAEERNDKWGNKVEPSTAAQQQSSIQVGEKAAGKHTAFAKRYIEKILLITLDLATGVEIVTNKNTYVLMKIRRGVYNTYHVRIKYWVVAGIPYQWFLLYNFTLFLKSYFAFIF